jgi:predicted nucleic acid-binding protein
VILDTSAVIGWVELKDQGVISAIRERSDGVAPRIHVVTAGELERGVVSAPDESTRVRRRATLRFAREQLDPCGLTLEGDQAEAFGHLAHALSRKVTHNDTWIVAAAITEGRALLTQDAFLAERTTDAAAHGSLARWLSHRGYALEVVHAPRSPA